MKAKAVFLQLLVMLVGMAKGFLTLKLLVGLGHEQYAMLSQFIVLSMFMTQLVMLNYDAPFVAKMVSEDNPSKAYSAVMHLLIFNFAVVVCLVTVFDHEVADVVWGSAKFFDYVYPLAVYIFLLSLNLVSLLCFQSRKRFDLYAYFQIAQHFLQLIAVALGVVFESMWLLIILLMFGEFLLYVYGVLGAGRPKFIPSAIASSFEWLKENGKVARPLFFSFLMIWLLSNGGRFFMVHGRGLEELAAYAATLSIAVLAGIFINPVCSVFFPYFCKQRDSGETDSEKWLAIGQHVLVVVGGLISICLMGLAKFIIGLLASPQLFAGQIFVFFICAGQLFYGQARLTSLYLAVNGNPGAGQRGFLVGALVFLITAVVLVRDFGAQGVALAMMLGMLMAKIFLWKSLSLKDKNTSFLGKNSSALPILLIGFVAIFFLVFADFRNVFSASVFTLSAILLYMAFVYFIVRKSPGFSKLIDMSRLKRG